MILDRNEKKDVVVLLGAGAMGTAIVRRVAAGTKILLGDISENALARVSHDLRRKNFEDAGVRQAGRQHRSKSFLLFPTR